MRIGSASCVEVASKNPAPCWMSCPGHRRTTRKTCCMPFPRYLPGRRGARETASPCWRSKACTSASKCVRRCRSCWAGQDTTCMPCAMSSSSSCAGARWASSEKAVPENPPWHAAYCAWRILPMVISWSMAKTLHACATTGNWPRRVCRCKWCFRIRTARSIRACASSRA
ncbi:hypothetical protein D9M68_692690 [compost metagenome]